VGADERVHAGQSAVKNTTRNAAYPLAADLRAGGTTGLDPSVGFKGPTTTRDTNKKKEAR